MVMMAIKNRCFTQIIAIVFCVVYWRIKVALEPLFG